MESCAQLIPRKTHPTLRPPAKEEIWLADQGKIVIPNPRYGRINGRLIVELTPLKITGPLR